MSDEWVSFKAKDQPQWVKNENIILHDYVWKNGPVQHAMTCVDKKADDRPKYYRSYREELDGAVDESKGGGEQ